MGTEILLTEHSGTFFSSEPHSSRSDQIQSVGVENVTLDDDNYNDAGDILLQVRSVVFILLAIFLTICLL